MPKKLFSIVAVLKFLRPHHWAKNVLLALPLLASHRFDLRSLEDTFSAIIAFSLAASAGYIVNDIADVKADQKHHEKRNRLLAAGGISIANAALLASFLWAVSIALSISLLNVPFTGLIIIYSLLSLFYSLWIKRLLLLDILALSALYCIRIVAGAIAIDVELSNWLLAFALFFFNSLVFLKRYVEVKYAIEVSNDSLLSNRRAYEAVDLGVLISAGLSSGYLSVLVICLYINTDRINSLYSKPEAIWIIGFIIFYWVTRIWLLAARDRVEQDPVLFTLKDPASWLILSLVSVLFSVGIWL
ncbi:MAG: hypothetical protein C0608_04040 [Deltaproteobacteria bacterium]|mgnify:CR=1 FL=1|nr:MAG: hypothetical protein C0608_04040 [Deltaproteobacteria bacterium]